MKLRRIIAIGLLTGLGINPGRAQLQVLPDKEPQGVFAGRAREINMTWKNTSDKMTTAKIHARIWQTTSATAVAYDDVAWTRLQVLPHQTILTTARFDFPPVKAETKFLVQWLAGPNDILGATTVNVFPANLLAELKPLLGDATMGVYDPDNELKPALENSRVKFDDLEVSGFENFVGRLVVVKTISAQMPPERLLRVVKMLAQKNVAVVWIQPPLQEEKLLPSFYPVTAGTNAIVVAQPDLVEDFSRNPQSQINLIRLCRQALRPEIFSLASLNN
ncbi:MAG TPA: hypothetical protein VGO57_14040 [Verrucomicrobiae bacterium]|jgi:hypothetical protein